MSDRYAVIGNPVAHSKSPLIHAEFARQTGQDLVYERILAPLDGFAQAVAQFHAEGGKGLNVTLPFKLEAFTLADELSERARLAGAVNTLKFAEGRVFGDNTDGKGLVRDITQNLAFPIEGRRVLLVGAGGAARGALGPLLRCRPARLTIANRTPEKAQELARLIRPLEAGQPAIEAKRFDELANDRFDLVVNATAASLADERPPLPDGIFAEGALAYDMMYGRGLTPFLRWAQARGARVADGLGMLVEQAAESFFVWRGVRPDTAPVLAMLRKAA